MLNKFSKNNSGNFSQMSALIAVPVILTIGAAVDYSIMSRENSKLQNSLDAAILAVGRDFESREKSAVVKELKNFLKSNLSASEYKKIGKITVEVDKKNHSLTAKAEAKIDTNFMLLAGIKTLPYDATSQIKSASGGIEIAFVLDNTGSMAADGKIVSLKEAATAFTEAMMLKDTGGSTKIGIVPFSNHVNVGMSNRNASWLQVDADSTVTEPNYCYMTQDLISSGSCTTQTGYNDGVAYTYQQCNNVYGAPYQVCGPQTITTTWYGCVGSREEPLNLEDRNYNKRVPGLMNTSCGAPIRPLTDNKQTILDDIDAMFIGGETYIPSGLTWGQRVLSSGEPFVGGVSKSQAKKDKIKKYLILMTDGDNTKSAQLPGAPSHWGSDVTQANSWTAKACNNIKSEDISVFTVTFGTLTNETKDLIQNCASNSSQYYHATTGNDLKAAFNDIQAQISALHLSM